MALPSYLSAEDLAKFRTRFCERLLQLGECSFGDKCQYSHNVVWRRRSPNKYAYEPVMCPNVILWRGISGKLQLSINCPEGKCCRSSHSFEEVLYHPRIYKSVACDALHCQIYYCPFAHNPAELSFTSSRETPRELVNRCIGLLDFRELFPDEEPSPTSPQLAPTDFWLRSTSRPRPYIPPVTPAEAAENAAWVTVGPGVKLESVTRARSAAIPSDLCRALWTLKGERRHVVVKAMQLPVSDALVGMLLEEHVRLHAPAGQSPAHYSYPDEHFVPIRKLLTQPEGLFLVMDRCVTSLEGGIPEGLLGRMTPPVFAARVGEILRAIGRMHSLGIPHMRICPSNILVDSDASWRLADCFGKYRILCSPGPLPPAVAIWQAPEVLCGGRVDWFKADVWSIGVTLAYALTGKTPFSTPEAVVRDELHIQSIPALILDLIFRSIQPDPDDRPTINEMLGLPLFWGVEGIQEFVPVVLEISTEEAKEGSMPTSTPMTTASSGSSAQSPSTAPDGRGTPLQSFVTPEASIKTCLLSYPIERGKTVWSVLLEISKGSDADVLVLSERYPIWMVRAYDAWRLSEKCRGQQEANFVAKYGGALAEENLDFSEPERAREYYATVSAAMAGREIVVLGSFLDKMLEGSSEEAADDLLLDSCMIKSSHDEPWEYAVYCPPQAHQARSWV